MTKQYYLSVSTGKRLIARAIVAMPEIKEALVDHTIVIISGSTNGYIAEELLNAIGQKRDFTKDTFFRGANVEQGIKIERGNYSDTDIVIYKGTWLKDKTISKEDFFHHAFLFSSPRHSLGLLV